MIGERYRYRRWPGTVRAVQYVDEFDPPEMRRLGIGACIVLMDWDDGERVKAGAWMPLDQLQPTLVQRRVPLDASLDRYARN